MHPISNIHYSHLNSATGILEQYDGSIPFAHFVKNYFSQHKKFGSRDRKQIGKLCYAFFRLGKSFPEVRVKERILLALKYVKEPVDLKWQEIINESHLPGSAPENIFPWKNELSEGVDPTAFEASFALQPDLFLRIRPGHEKMVLKKLESSKIDFVSKGSSLRLATGAKIDDLLQLNKEVVVQDLSSQKIAKFLQLVKNSFTPGRVISVYDCCAASGGKSILAQDELKQISLTVSDIRPSIIHNLQKRFLQADIKNYRAFVQDITRKHQPVEQYDLVIADVPCTGSGAWARTPEQLYFFNETKIAAYADLQKRIVQNLVKTVKPGGFLLYVTCSVFKRENEGQVANLEKSGFALIHQEIITGYKEKADSMFGALMKRPEG